MSDDATAPWLQLTLEAIDHPPDQLEDALLQAGALAVTLEDAGDQPVSYTHLDVYKRQSGG